MTPDEIELAHNDAVLRLHAAATAHDRRVAWNDVKRYKAMRNAETVERLERERGIFTEAK